MMAALRQVQGKARRRVSQSAGIRTLKTVVVVMAIGAAAVAAGLGGRAYVQSPGYAARQFVRAVEKRDYDRLYELFDYSYQTKVDDATHRRLMAELHAGLMPDLTVVQQGYPCNEHGLVLSRDRYHVRVRFERGTGEAEVSSWVIELVKEDGVWKVAFTPTYEHLLSARYGWQDGKALLRHIWQGLAQKMSYPASSP